DGIRDDLVTGVQTCALPIYRVLRHGASKIVLPMTFLWLFVFIGLGGYGWIARKRWMVAMFGSIPCTVGTYYLLGVGIAQAIGERSEERRVGNECGWTLELGL